MFSQCTERKNWVIYWPKKSLAEQKFDTFFLGQNDSIFLSVHREKKWVILNLKVESLEDTIIQPTFITGRLNPWIILLSNIRTASMKQDDQRFISILYKLRVTRWVKLSLNFELLEEDFLFYIYCQRID